MGLLVPILANCSLAVEVVGLSVDIVVGCGATLTGFETMFSGRPGAFRPFRIDGRGSDITTGGGGDGIGGGLGATADGISLSGIPLFCRKSSSISIIRRKNFVSNDQRIKSPVKHLRTSTPFEVPRQANWSFVDIKEFPLSCFI
jgi:hypothetical protein